MAVVYQITNLVNGHSYIGVTKHTSKKRWKQHVYAAGRREYTSLLVSISGISSVCLGKRNRVYGLHFNFI